MSITPIDQDALLTRVNTAAALTALGYVTSAATLATKATRGGGPPYQMWMGRALYRWRDALAWAQSQMRPARGTPESNPMEKTA
jgi:hypothetical protein